MISIAEEVSMQRYKRLLVPLEYGGRLCNGAGRFDAARDTLDIRKEREKESV